MLETLMKLYVASQAGHVHSPMPHLFGPPGTNKSGVCHQLAELLGVDLHIINVSRISPLELEGVQMPVDGNTRLHLLTATFWTQLKDGDILLLDEFLRGFPEVYNGLLDILTSRQVGGFKLPNVFIIGASNSTVAYDKALEDRLLHITVPDIRKTGSRHGHRSALCRLIAEQIGLLPEMASTLEMSDLITKEVEPMYAVLDQLGGRVGAQDDKGHSARNLIGQVKLRHVQSTHLQAVIDFNNIRAMAEDKPQYVVIVETKGLLNLHWMSKYIKAAHTLRGNAKLTEIQALNLELNLQLIGMEEARIENKETVDVNDIDPF